MTTKTCDCVGCNNEAKHILPFPRNCYVIVRNTEGDILSKFYQGVSIRNTNICDEHYRLLAGVFNSTEIRE